MATILTWSMDLLDSLANHFWFWKKDPYKRLQRRLDMYPAGAPYSEELVKILHILVRPEDVRFAQKISPSPMDLGKLAKRMKMSEEDMNGVIDRLAYAGMVLDWHAEGKRWGMLSPVVVGFFEFLFMRTKRISDLPVAELADLFNTYFFEKPEFAKSVCPSTSSIQIARTLCREEVMDDSHEILDYERASELIKQATNLAISDCSCRSHMRARGENIEECSAPLETCFSLNTIADSVIKNGYGRKISPEEGLEILKNAKSHSLLNIADNVKNDVAFLCNCCQCCCGFLKAIRDRHLEECFVTSNWEMKFSQEDLDDCVGCGNCVDVCPIDAIHLDDDEHPVRGDVCLGCGVCAAECPNEVLKMHPREKRVYTPSDRFELTIAMAIERKTLHKLIFYDPDSFSHATCRLVTKVLEYSPAGAAIRAIEPLRSVFLERCVKLSSPSDRVLGMQRMKSLKESVAKQSAHIESHLNGGLPHHEHSHSEVSDGTDATSHDLLLEEEDRDQQTSDKRKKE